MTKVNIKQVENEPEIPFEVMVKSIEQIAKSMQVLSESRLRREAVVTLIQHRSKVSRKDIEIVLNNLRDLEMDYLKPKS